MLQQEILTSIAEGKKLKDLESEVCEELQKHPKTIVILDDDPTGTQTVFNIPVITEWNYAVIEKEVLTSPVFFILTNSRSLKAEAANSLGKRIGERLRAASDQHNKKLVVISRSDSTLRGHYPNEVDALVSGLGWSNTKHILAPAFFEGGRYTFRDIHYVQDGEEFLPAAETPFAKDNTFGYTTSDLKKWVAEKTEERTKENEVLSIGVDVLREKSTKELETYLTDAKEKCIVVNATCPIDLQAFALACLKYDNNLIFRTSASFVNAISGIPIRDRLTKNEIIGDGQGQGSLIVVGSYVPKTTTQLNYLKEHSDTCFLVLDVTKVLDDSKFEHFISELSRRVNALVSSGQQVVLFTSRAVAKGNTKTKSLEIVNTVSNAIIRIVKQLDSRPKYILAKGGITSSDVATKGLGVKRARVLGQLLKGVPVWKLGKETKFPNMPYIIFPGNVGDESSLYNAITLLE